jgi:hypothetical protein
MYEFTSDIRPFISEWILLPPHIAVVSNKPYTHKFIEKHWSKRDAFLLMGINESAIFTESYQLWAGFVAFQNTFYGVQYLAEWLTYVQDVRIVDDSPSKITGCSVISVASIICVVIFFTDALLAGLRFTCRG